MKNYLAIDIGTTNWKVAVFNEVGNLIDIERTPTKTHQDDMGNSYYDPSELWREVSALARAVTKRVGGSISAVSVTSMAEAVVAIDENKQTVGDIIAWFDNRSFREAQWMKDKFTVERLYEITGLDVNPIFSMPKILWVKKNQPEIYEKAVMWLQMSDFILFKLSGEFVTDYTLASRTLAFDVVENVWSEEIMNGCDVPVSVMPTIHESGSVIGSISKAVSEETGISQGAKIVVGGNDHPCASIPAGVVSGDKILDSSGTAESFIYVSKKGEVPKMKFEGQRTCRYLQKDRYALWGGIICSGRSCDWAYETFVSSGAFGISQEEYSYDTILSAVEKGKGVEKGLLFLPHLRGAGAPHWNPKISGSFLGVRDNVTAPDMIKAVFEGLAMQARMIAEMEEQLSGVSVKSLCVVGGSSKNLVWQQIKADVTNKNIEISDQSEATALGAAMLAAIGDGVYSGIEEVTEMLSKQNKVLTPNAERTKLYDKHYEIFKKAYKALEEVNEDIFNTIKG